MTNGPLYGFRALDLTDEKGVFCGKILTDLGVDVIKVEKPGGDPMRNIPPFYHDETDQEKSLYWFAFNVNKKSITLNLKTGQGQDLFRRLVERVDFVIESFPPGYMDKLGLGYENLKKIDPQIIMTSITFFGQSGPYSGFKASDLVLQSLGVLMHQFGDPDRAPVRISAPQAFMHAGADAAEGTMVAHYYRGATGEGQHIDVSAMESVAWSTHNFLPPWDASKTAVQRTGTSMTASGFKTPNIWKCKDGYVSFTTFGGFVGARNNSALTEWMDGEQMAPGFMKEKDWENWDWNQTTQAELDSIFKAIALFFENHTKEELQEGAIKRDIMLYSVCNPEDMANNVQLRARDFWVNIEDSELSDTITYPGPFAKFSHTPIESWRRAPRIGEHNNDIYVEELGLSKDQFASLKAEGII
ncbi:CaiB/BaiF CoA transferase family protein [Thermodesulfobacteriota bacterium]